LIIEDDEEMIALGELILKREGYDILSATSGPAGLAMLHAASPDLILLDVLMDGMDGWAVLDEIKSHERWQGIPVIMLTAQHYLEDEQETAKYADQYAGYIVKPFLVQELVDQVARVLATHAQA
jgi:CheY-like chemotaxis protein